MAQIRTLLFVLHEYVVDSIQPNKSDVVELQSRCFILCGGLDMQRVILHEKALIFSIMLVGDVADRLPGGG